MFSTFSLNFIKSNESYGLFRMTIIYPFHEQASSHKGKKSGFSFNYFHKFRNLFPLDIDSSCGSDDMSKSYDSLDCWH